MLPPLANLAQEAAKAKPATQKLFTKLKRVKPRELDDQFHDLHQQVFAQTDCLACANCCKTTSPIFYQKDIERLAKALRLKPAAFIAQYLHLDPDGDYVLNHAPCPFLAPDNHCTVYAHRPTACREYPHTDRKRMAQILDLTLHNTEICPATFRIVERLKKLYAP
jgi:uncharacterized protein